MGRPSKLTESQWEQIGRRLVNGEKAATLAKEFKVSPTAISNRFSKATERIKTVADQIVTTEQALNALSVSEQIAAVSLARTLRSTLEHMASAAELGARNTHKLLGLANAQMIKIGEVDPLRSLDVLRGIGALTKLANDSAVVPTAMISGSKDAVKRQMQDEDVQTLPVQVVIQVEDASVPEA